MMSARLAAVILALAAGPLRAQQIPEVPEDATVEVRNLGQCGLVTRYASSQIGDNCLADAFNVYLDEDLGIVRRKGYSKFNATAITEAQSVRGIWPFRATDGTQYIVALSSGTMYKSSGDGTLAATTPAISGKSLTQDMDCSQCLGKLWCVNGSDSLFFWDGASSGTVSGAPTCSAVDCFRNRVVLGNCSGTLSQLRLSGELDGTDYSIPSAPVSTSPAAISLGGVNDGNRVQCIMGAYQDVLVAGKIDSTWGLYGFDRRDFVVRELSREVGCIENRSAREKQNSLYWLSKRGVEKMTGPKIERVSDPIRDLVDTVIVAGGNSRSATDTSQADFQAGNLIASGLGSPMSATIVPASVVPSTWGIAPTLNSQWQMSDVDTAAISSDYWDDFTDGNSSANPAWASVSGTPAVIYNTAIGSTSVYAVSEPSSRLNFYTSQTISTGTWSVVVVSTNASLQVDFWYVADNNDFLSASRINGYVALIQTSGGQARCKIIYTATSSQSIFSDGTLTTVNPSDGQAHNWTFTRNSNGFHTCSVDGNLVASGSDTTFAGTQSYFVMDDFNMGGSAVGNTFYSRFRFPGYYENQVSRAYDIGLSTPVMGQYSAAMSSSSVSSVTFQTALSATLGGTYTFAAQTNGGRPSPDGRRFFKHKVFVAPPSATPLATISTVTVTAATTGYFISQCRNPGSAITSWGLLQCNFSAGSPSFAISTGATCGAAIASTATWNTQTNNALITAPTAPYTAYRVLADTSTILNDCTINWNEGTTRPSVSAEVYRDRYYLAYTSGTSGTVANDHIAVLDSRDQWVLHDAPNCASLGIYNRGLYCGDSASSGFVYQMDVGQDDAGASFMSRIRTKDFDFGNPFQRKILSRIYYDLAGLPDLSYSIDLTPSYTLDASTDSFSLDPIGLDEDYSRFISAKVPADLSKNTTGRWFNFGLTHTGNQGPWKLYGLKFGFSRLKED